MQQVESSAGKVGLSSQKYKIYTPVTLFLPSFTRPVNRRVLPYHWFCSSFLLVKREVFLSVRTEGRCVVLNQVQLDEFTTDGLQSRLNGPRTKGLKYVYHFKSCTFAILEY